MEEIRQKIDAIDRQMAALYEQRMDLAKAVAEYKFTNDGKIYDSVREAAVVEKNVKQLKNSQYEKSYIDFLHFVMDQSKALQTDYFEKMKTENR